MHLRAEMWTNLRSTCMLSCVSRHSLFKIQNMHAAAKRTNSQRSYLPVSVAFTVHGSRSVSKFSQFLRTSLSVHSCRHAAKRYRSEFNTSLSPCRKRRKLSLFKHQIMATKFNRPYARFFFLQKLYTTICGICQFTYRDVCQCVTS